MIHESFYWKNELYRSYLTISKFRHLKRITELSEMKVEKALMIGAYIIRKLDDAQKIPPDFLLRKELLEFSTSKDTIVDHLNWHKIETHYNFDKVMKSEKEWKFIINQIIHSFTLIFSFDEYDKLDGFLINSDKTKKVALFFLPIQTLLTMFLNISEGDITEASYQRQLVGKDSNGALKHGEMKLIKAVYSYPNGFNIKNIISSTMSGNIYKRPPN